MSIIACSSYHRSLNGIGNTIELSSNGKRFDHGLEEKKSVGGTKKALAGAIRMRHHAEDIAAFVEHTSDIFERTVWIRSRGNFSRGGYIAKGDAFLGLQLSQGAGVAEVVALHVADGHVEDAATLQPVGKGRVSGLDAEVDLLTDVALAGVAHQGAGQEAGFAEDLEAVADTHDKAAIVGE